MYVYFHIRTDRLTDVQTHVRTHVHRYIHAYMHTYIHVCIYIYTPTYMYTHISYTDRPRESTHECASFIPSQTPMFDAQLRCNAFRVARVSTPLSCGGAETEWML